MGHGTREQRGLDQFRSLVRQVRSMMPLTPVASCFLEIAEPTIGQGFDRLARVGVDRITVVPLMLLAAGHVRRDVPGAVAEAATHYPRIKVRQAAHLGCRRQILELSTRRYAEALAPRPAVPASQTVLVLVGRGSHQAEARQEMLHFSECRRRTTPGVEVRTAFLAMAEPTLGEMLQEVGRRRPQRVVVQPHLLFDGRLLGRARAETARWAKANGLADWIVAAPLGPDRLLAQIVVEASFAGTDRDLWADEAEGCPVPIGQVVGPLEKHSEV